MEITGKVHVVGEVLSIPTKSGSTFNKRELVLDCTRYDPMTGEPYPNYVVVEFGGNKVSQLDGVQAGMLVTVSFALQGYPYEDKNDKSTKYITKVAGWKVDPYQRGQAQQQVAQPAQQMQPVQQEAQMPQYDGGVNYPPMQGDPFPSAVPGQGGKNDDLPF